MVRRGARRAALFVLALVGVAALWELYKVVGPEAGGEVFGWRVIPKASDQAMPHTWEMASRLFDPEVRGKDTVRLTSPRAEADRRLGDLPAAGREAYEKAFGGTASSRSTITASGRNSASFS